MISVLIASARNPNKVVDHILGLPKNDKVEEEYEIIICTRDKIEIPNKKVKIIEDPAGNIGGIKPLNKAFKESQGDYFIVSNDDVFMSAKSFDVEEFLESENFENRKYKICAVGQNTSNPARVPTQKHSVPILAYPAGKRDTIEKLMGGVIFNESFKHIYGDNWLSYYLDSKEEGPIFMPDTMYNYGEDSREPGSNVVRGEDQDTFFSMIAYCEDNPSFRYEEILPPPGIDGLRPPKISEVAPT